MKLLIVDDSQSMRQFLRRLLAEITTDIQECEDGSGALECYRTFLPDFVLMDLEMKQVNGLQATRQIVASYPKAKVIIVTNFDDPALRTQAQAAGARAYVMKEQMTDLARILQGLPSSQNLL